MPRFIIICSTFIESHLAKLEPLILGTTCYSLPFDKEDSNLLEKHSTNLWFKSDRTRQDVNKMRFDDHSTLSWVMAPVVVEMVEILTAVYVIGSQFKASSGHWNL